MTSGSTQQSRIMRVAAIAALIAAASFRADPAAAQQVRVTAADYDRASQFLGQNVAGLVVGGSVDANWLPDGRFWYRSTTPTGTEAIIVDPSKRTRA
jgi:hypothetical protein